MRQILLGLILISLLACNSKKNKEEAKNEVHTLIMDSVKTVIKPKSVFVPLPNYIVAFEDSINIYASPTDTSKVISFLNTFEKKEHYAGKPEEINQRWIPIENYGDTAWVYTHDNISLKHDVDTINNIAIHNRINVVEICGICYTYSIVENIDTKEHIYRGELSRQKSCFLNDSIFLINCSSEFILYNINSKVLEVHPNVFSIELDKENNSIYSLRLQKKQWQFHRSERQHLFEIVKFDYNSNVSKVLYTTPHDSLSPSFMAVQDGTGMTEFNLKNDLDTLYLSFNLYVERDNPECEFEPFRTTYHLLVDTLCNFKIEKLN